MTRAGMHSQRRIIDLQIECMDDQARNPEKQEIYMVKAWQSRPPRGTAVELPEVLALAEGPDPGTSPKVMRVGERVLVHYSQPRLFLDRAAWEALTRPDDVIVQRIRSADTPTFSIAMTRSELEDVFGSVKETQSWRDVCCYHFPTLPPAVDSFRVRTRGSAERLTPASLTSPPITDLKLTPASPILRPVPLPIEVPVHSTVGWAQQWAARVGARSESSAYLASVAEWRDCWRPAKVRVLLIAESHVAEQEGDMAVRVCIPGRAQDALPSSYCRLVYCLGYGESELCNPNPVQNSGTWQFWDIFGAIAGGRTQTQPRKIGSSLVDRLRWKLEVLTWLRDQGVWLVDACVAGVYQPGGGRAVAGADYGQMVRDSFEQFVWPSVANEPIEQIWVVGVGVSRALSGHMAMVNARTIVQPQGDRGEPGRHRCELSELVDSVRAIVPARP